MEFKCPHCGKPIRLIGQTTIKEEFGLGPNSVALRRKKGIFPEPVINLGNRLLFIREEVEEAIERDLNTRIEDFVENLERTIASLPEEEQRQARQALERRLQGSSTHRTRAH